MWAFLLGKGALNKREGGIFILPRIVVVGSVSSRVAGGVAVMVVITAPFACRAPAPRMPCVYTHEIPLAMPNFWGILGFLLDKGALNKRERGIFILPRIVVVGSVSSRVAGIVRRGGDGGDGGHHRAVCMPRADAPHAVCVHTRKFPAARAAANFNPAPKARELPKSP